jgi:hypothetical protein
MSAPSAETRWIRAALTGDDPERRRIAREELPGGPRFRALLIVCALVADRLFGGQWDRRVITTFARRVVERTPAAAGLVPRHVEAVLRCVTGELELVGSVPDEEFMRLVAAALFGLVDELALDDGAVSALLAETAETEEEVAAPAPLEELSRLDELVLPDDDRWRRTFERGLTRDDFRPRAHTVARPPLAFPAEERRTVEPVSLAGRFFRHFYRGDDPEVGPREAEIPLIDKLRVVRRAFTIAVLSYYLHPAPDLTETMALAVATKARHPSRIDLMKAEYLTRTALGETVPLDGITNRDVYPSCILMLETMFLAWDRDDGAIRSILVNAEEGVAERGDVLER